MNFIMNHFMKFTNFNNFLHLKLHGDVDSRFPSLVMMMGRFKFFEMFISNSKYYERMKFL